MQKLDKIKDKGNAGRTYQRCYGAPFMLQLSGSGLVGDFPNPADLLIKYSYFSQKLAGHIKVL